jgi:hypothetical protein
MHFKKWVFAFPEVYREVRHSRGYSWKLTLRITIKRLKIKVGQLAMVLALKEPFPLLQSFQKVAQAISEHAAIRIPDNYQL